MTIRPDTVTINARGEVTIPFFRVGAPEPDLAAMLAATRPAVRR